MTYDLVLQLDKRHDNTLWKYETPPILKKWWI